jgi:hypothetical protein
MQLRQCRLPACIWKILVAAAAGKRKPGRHRHTAARKPNSMHAAHTFTYGSALDVQCTSSG